MGPRDWGLFARAVVLWGVGFAGGVAFRRNLPDFSSGIAFFLTAVVLVILSFLWVAGLSRLAFHRTTYMAIGAVGLILVIPVARPFVERTHGIEQVAAGFSDNFLLGAALAQVPGANREWPIIARNHLHERASDFLEECFPENRFRIFLLCLSQLLLAGGIGLWIGGGIDEKSHLIPIALVATLADTWSVSGGATALIIRSSHIHFFLLRFPLLSGNSDSLPFLIGLTDFLFFGIYYQAAVRFGLGIQKNVLLLGAGFLTTVGVALYFHVGLPVLPFISVLFVVGNLRQLSLKKKDLSQIAMFLCAVGAAFLAFSWLVGGKP